MGVVGLEAQPRGDACEFAGAAVDQQIELAVGVEEGGGEDAAGFGIFAEEGEMLVVGEPAEAALDGVMQVHLQRLNGAEAPEDRQDDLPERVHGQHHTLAQRPVRSNGLYPPIFDANGLM